MIEPNLDTLQGFYDLFRASYTKVFSEWSWYTKNGDCSERQNEIVSNFGTSFEVMSRLSFER